MDSNTIKDREYARRMDENDPLKEYREHFHIPVINNKPALYFTGNSLGLQPKTTEKFLREELDTWKTLGVQGHLHGRRPWFHYHKFGKKTLAGLAGAMTEEVVAANNLTTNLHLMLTTFYRPTSSRYMIITEGGSFPSDIYALESQVRHHGLDPNEAIIQLMPEPGEHTLKTEKILEAIEKAGHALALVMMGGVQYYTGQFFDLKAITEKAHQAGAYCGFDLAHAMGNVPLHLHYDAVDFAVWCSYKYLNSGPGGTGGMFVHQNHGQNPELPRLAGWWGYEEDNRFEMKPGFRPMPGADGWQLSNVNILSGAAHLASLELFERAGIENLNRKSRQLTGLLFSLLRELQQEGYPITIITPDDPEQRGAQCAFLAGPQGRKVYEYLGENNVVADWRAPEAIRIAPVPFYNAFTEVYDFYAILRSGLKAIYG